MKHTQTIKNETINKTIDVSVDSAGFAYYAEVRTQPEVEMNRQGQILTVPQLNKLFTYYHAANHKLTPVK